MTLKVTRRARFAGRRTSSKDESAKLIRLRQKIKTDVSNVSEETALLASLDRAAAELDASKGVPIERVRENHA